MIFWRVISVFLLIWGAGINGFSVEVAHAQNTAPSSNNSNQPIEITADKSLEWYKNESKIIARDNARVKQGDTSINANILTAYYNENSSGDIGLKNIEADGNVVLKSRDNAVYGARATYDITTGKAIMRGENLRMVSPNQTLTARDSFQYDINVGRVTALGAVKIDYSPPSGKRNTLTADKAVATLVEQSGKRVLKTLEARGNVVIQSATETITGTYALYNALTNTAEMSGRVTIKRGQNTLEGARAEVDLNTNQSRLFGAPNILNSGGTGTSNGRVRGVFYPQSQN